MWWELGKNNINTQDKKWQGKITIETRDLNNGKVDNSLQNVFAETDSIKKIKIKYQFLIEKNGEYLRVTLHSTSRKHRVKMIL